MIRKRMRQETYAGVAETPFRGGGVSTTVHATRFGTDPDNGLSSKSRSVTFISSAQYKPWRCYRMHFLVYEKSLNLQLNIWGGCKHRIKRKMGIPLKHMPWQSRTRNLAEDRKSMCIIMRQDGFCRRTRNIIPIQKLYTNFSQFQESESCMDKSQLTSMNRSSDNIKTWGHTHCWHEVPLWARSQKHTNIIVKFGTSQISGCFAKQVSFHIHLLKCIGAVWKAEEVINIRTWQRGSEWTMILTLSRPPHHP